MDINWDGVASAVFAVGLPHGGSFAPSRIDKMALSDPPMLPEDRKFLDVPLMPAPGKRFQKDGIVWVLVGVRGRSEQFTQTRLTLEFVAVDSVKPV